MSDLSAPAFSVPAPAIDERSCSVCATTVWNSSDNLSFVTSPWAWLMVRLLVAWFRKRGPPNGPPSRARRSTCGSVAQQHRDLQVAARLRIAESAGLDLVGRHAGFDQRRAHVAHMARVVAVDSDAVRGILVRVGRDLPCLAAVAAGDPVAVRIEGVVAIHAPASVRGHRALGARRADRALRAFRADGSPRPAHARELGGTFRTRISGRALRSGQAHR